MMIIMTTVPGHGSGAADDPGHPAGGLPGLRADTALAGQHPGA